VPGRLENDRTIFAKNDAKIFHGLLGQLNAVNNEEYALVQASPSSVTMSLYLVMPPLRG